MKTTTALATLMAPGLTVLCLTTPAFADIPAVRNDRFFTLEYVEATPGPRNIAAIKRLAEAFAAR